MNFVIASHIVFFDNQNQEVHGPPHIVWDYIKTLGARTMFIKLDLNAYGRAVVEKYKGKKLVWKKTYPTLPGSLKHLGDFALAIVKGWEGGGKETVFIGIDPLNGLAGAVLKKLGKAKKLVYHTPDYSPRKYQNNFMEKLYRFADNRSIKNADHVWAVSEKILELRKKQGVLESKLFHIPNSPIATSPSTIRKNSKSLVFLTGNITKAVNLKLCQEAARSLKTTLFVIGESGQDDKHTKFLGKMPYQKVLKNLPQFGIGLAFYTKEEPWTTYCDPVKVRDYLACGLPVVVNQVPPVAKDIAKYQAGEIANDNVKSIASACKKIQQNYQTYSKNALKMARDFNSHPIICQALEKL